MHLSIVRKLFSESATSCLSPVKLDQAVTSDVVPAAGDDSTANTAARADICQQLMKKDTFLSNLVQNEYDSL